LFSACFWFDWDDWDDWYDCHHGHHLSASQIIISDAPRRIPKLWLERRRFQSVHDQFSE
jgi:hypothetical protein